MNLKLQPQNFPPRGCAETPRRLRADDAHPSLPRQSVLFGSCFTVLLILVLNHFTAGSVSRVAVRAVGAGVGNFVINRSIGMFMTFGMIHVGVRMPRGKSSGNGSGNI